MGKSLEKSSQFMTMTHSVTLHWGWVYMFTYIWNKLHK